MKKPKRLDPKKFGEYLSRLRTQNTELSQTEAAMQLGLQRQELNQYEKGTRNPPDSLLIRLAHLYHVPTAEVLERAYWPQLILLPLIAIIYPEQLSKNIIEELQKGLEEKERKQLTEYIEKLLKPRCTAGSQ